MQPSGDAPTHFPLQDEVQQECTVDVPDEPSSTPFPSLTELRLRKEIEEPKSATITSKVTLNHLRNTANSIGATPTAAIQAAWAVILSTYTAAQEDVVFATAGDHHGIHGPDDLNHVALRIISTRVCLNNSGQWGQGTNRSVLEYITASNASAMGLPKLGKVSTSRHKGLFKHGTLIAVHTKQSLHDRLDDCNAFSKLLNSLLKSEELAVAVSAGPGTADFLDFKVYYTKRYLNKASAIVMLKQLEDVLAYILEDPTKSIADSLAAVRTSLLSASNEIVKDSVELNPDSPPYLHSQFENFARDNPHCVALEFRSDIHTENSTNDTTWTYAQLNKRADQLAWYLNQRFGQLSDEVIPICMDRCPELYVAILGVLKSGAAWCPIDVAFPARRRHDLIARTRSRLLIVAEPSLAHISEVIPEGVVTVDITRPEDLNINRTMTANISIGRLAYLIWTSGTTGVPKGVPIHHEAAVTSMRALQKSIPVDVKGGIVRCLQFSQFTFDVFIQDLFYTWGVGGTVISSTREIMLGSFAQLANTTNATHAHLTPAFAASVPRAKCQTLEVITMIGEKLPQAVADDWSQDMRAYNTYGPAESTVVATLRRFGAPGDEGQSENIGHPLPSVSAFVMRDGLPVMKHGMGELALGGPQLSKGYWHDPERSSGRFVWNKQYSRNLYMTGDVVRQLYDGSLEFVGRTDDLIKIQGIRVELSEIGFALRTCHPLIEQVEIQYFDRKDRPSKVIVAFLAAPGLGNFRNHACHIITGKDAVRIAKQALQEAQKILPDYMIPRVLLVVSSIPRTTSNKIDKPALKELYSSINLGSWESTVAANYNNTTNTATWTERESKIIATVAELSGTSQHSMSRISDLRSIGIDSIAATRLVPMLNARGFSLASTDILQCQTLDDLLTTVEKPRCSESKNICDLDAFHKKWYSRVSQILQNHELYVIPALPLQQSLLSESMQYAKAYWSHTFLLLDAQIDIDRLHEAWSQVVSDTEALRTGFIPSAAIREDNHEALSSDSTFLQLIYQGAVVDWTHFQSLKADLKDLAAHRAHVIAEEHQKKYFRDPLLTITVFDQPNTRAMMISIHHAIRDEASLDFVLEDVRKSYLKIGETSTRRHQLSKALKVMLPNQRQVNECVTFWSKALANFATNDDTNIWPDLTGRNTQSEDPATGFITHNHAFKMSYNDLQVAALGIAASSVASVLLVAWGCMILTYRETDSVVFAETWSNRMDDLILADVVGPLISVLPVPFRAAGSAREALVERSILQRESRAHCSIHSRTIRKLLGRSEKQNLYPAIFNFVPNLNEDEDSRHGHTSLWTKIDNMVGLSVEHPMALNVAQTINGVLEMGFHASQNVMNPANLVILAQQLEAFVQAMLNYPDVPLTQLSSHLPENLLSKTSVYYSEEVKYAWKQNPTDWVDHYAAIQPNWPAAQVVNSLSDEEPEFESWTFAELHSAYRRVAAFIKHSGHRNQMIAVWLDRRIEAYAVVLGILASGNTYLPIDEDLPEERKSFLLQDSNAAMLFTTRVLALSFPSDAHKSRVVYVDDNAYKDQLLTGHSFETTQHSQPSDNAYLLYTSGSTGVPKGVLVGRGNLCSFIEGLSEYIRPLIPGGKDLAGKGKYLGLASRAFDVHIAEMFLAWRQGLAAVTAPRIILLDNLELALRKLKITHASFVPSLIDQAGLDPLNLPDLHYLGVGGEKMSKRVIDTWASNENAALVNAYGPTELSIGCTAAVVTPDSNLRNVGRPYGNSVAHVLVPGTTTYSLRGVAGELCFTGALVANGYHNRPDAKGFVDNFNGERMYRTGDIVRLMPDDTVEYLRREDDQTKVRGQRLELGEISEAVRSSAAMTLDSPKVDVATMVVQHPKLSRIQLVSFVAGERSSSNGREPPEILRSVEDNAMVSKIQARCQKTLPAYMVPDVIIPLTRLPLAPSSGKADLKLLKAMFATVQIADMMNHTTSQQMNWHDSCRQELSEAEKLVRKAVMSTLAVDEAEISFNTNMFRLGLDSLSAISLAIRMQKLGYDCTVSSVLRNPILEQLALLPNNSQSIMATNERLTQTRTTLADLESRFRATHPHGLDGRSIRAVRPCLPLQETLIASSLNNKNGALYVNNVNLKLSPEIDLARLYQAWAGVIENHEILRTCFQEFENGIVQIVLEYDDSYSIPWQEFSTSYPDLACDNQQMVPATKLISEIGRKAPLRAIMYRPPSEARSPILSIRIHHALYDGDSFAMILDELDKRYRSATIPVYTPVDTIIEFVYSQDQKASRDFWTGYLLHYKPLPIVICADTINDSFNKASFKTVERTFASPLTGLEDFSSSVSGTLTSTVQAIFGIILAQTLRTDDVVFGAVLSGRTVPIKNPNTIVAPCITSIPQRVKLNTDSFTIVDIIKKSQQGFVGSLEYQHTALRHIHRWIGAERPLFDCLVTYVQKKQSRSESLSQLWTEFHGVVSHDFPLSIEFEADREANRLQAHCVFTPTFGDMNKASALMEKIDLLLGALVRGERITIKDLDLSNSDALESRQKPQIREESIWKPMELKVQKIAADICGIGVNDITQRASFFSLGIDSIIAIRFAKRLRQSGIECHSADVMRHSCIAALAQHVEGLPPHTNGVKRDTDRPRVGDLKEMIPMISRLTSEDRVTDVYACTPLQSSMLTQTLGSDGRLYVHHHAVRLSPHLNLTNLRRAWERLTMHTEILQTTFHFSGASSSWLAAVHQESCEDWAEYDTVNSVSNLLIQITKEYEFRDGADFEKPPRKASVLKTATENVLVVSMHHSLYDGESIHLLFQDLARLYKGDDIPLRPSFSDAARAIAKSTANAEDFWLRKLEGFENNAIPLSSKATDMDMVDIEVGLQMDIHSILQGCRDLGVTVQTVALLAYAKSLACVSGRRDVVFGHVVGGRSLAMPGADEVIGTLFNTVPSRFVFDKTYTTNETAATEVQQTSGDSQPHQHASLGRIQQKWQQQIGNADAQLFDSLFVFQNNANTGSSADILWTPLDDNGAVAPTEYSTNFEFEQREENIILRVASRKARTTESQLQTWLETFEQIFQDVLEKPHRSVLAFPASLQSLPLTIKSDKSHASSRDEIDPGPDLTCIRTVLSEITRISTEDFPVASSVFSIGLDSIAAIQVAATCRKRGYDISVADVLQGRSLGGICRRLRERSQKPQDSDAKSLETLVSTETKSKAVFVTNVTNDDVDYALPCLAGQVYHLASWLKSHRAMCEAVFTYECSERLDTDALCSAWERLKERHAILRTLFVAVSHKEAVQLVLKHPELGSNSFSYIESPNDSNERVVDLIKRETNQHFDLFVPPSRLCLFHHDSRDYILLKFHHATYDAWTINTIVSDLFAIYQGIYLPPPPSSASFIHHTVLTVDTHQQQSYWFRTLQNSQPTILHPRPNPGSTPTIHTLKTTIANLQTLETTCRHLSFSLPTLLILAYARTLAQHTSTTSPTFGLYTSGRSASWEGLAQLCFPCVNVLPVSVADALTRPVGESLGALQKGLGEGVGWEQSFLGEVVGRVGRGKPLFNTWVNILQEVDGGDDVLSPLSSSSSSASSKPNLFTPYQPPPNTMPELLRPPATTKMEKTAVDALDTTFLAETNLYLDIVRNIESDVIDLAIKCDGELMDEDAVKTFAAGVVGEVGEIVAAVGGYRAE